MKNYRSRIIMSLSLVAGSAGVYLLQNIFFHDFHSSMFYLMQDLAFLPLQVLLGVLIIDRIIQTRETKRLMRKMNMVIGVFFMETGDALLCRLSVMLRNREALDRCCTVKGGWTKKDYAAASAEAKAFLYDVLVSADGLNEMKSFLESRRDCILRLLENPNLLEHERFTDLLWAVSHLGEELHRRENLELLSQPDAEHLKGDVIRAYRLLVIEWLSYMKHLQSEYPYLFSLSVRVNPFKKDARAEIDVQSY